MTAAGPPSPSRLSLSSLGCLIATLSLLGCENVLQGTSGGFSSGGGPSGDALPYEHAAGPEDVIVSIDLSGWDGPLVYELRNTASFLLLGDGTVIVQGATDMRYPGPAINPLLSATVTEAQIQTLLGSAEAAGLLGDHIDYGEPGITDQATTYVDISLDGRTVSQAAYALDYDDPNFPNLSQTARAARNALRDFISTAQALVPVDGQRYQPDALLVYRLSEVGEVPVETGLEQPARTWPITTVPSAVDVAELSSCVAISGPEAGVLWAALADATELTPWLIGPGPPTYMAFRAYLPGDDGCEG